MAGCARRNSNRNNANGARSAPARGKPIAELEFLIRILRKAHYLLAVRTGYWGATAEPPKCARLSFGTTQRRPTRNLRATRRCRIIQLMRPHALLCISILPILMSGACPKSSPSRWEDQRSESVLSPPARIETGKDALPHWEAGSAVRILESFLPHHLEVGRSYPYRAYAVDALDRLVPDATKYSYDREDLIWEDGEIRCLNPGMWGRSARAEDTSMGGVITCVDAGEAPGDLPLLHMVIGEDSMTLEEAVLATGGAMPSAGVANPNNYDRWVAAIEDGNIVPRRMGYTIINLIYGHPSHTFAISIGRPHWSGKLRLSENELWMRPLPAASYRLQMKFEQPVTLDIGGADSDCSPVGPISSIITDCFLPRGGSFVITNAVENHSANEGHLRILRMP